MGSVGRGAGGPGGDLAPGRFIISPFQCLKRQPKKVTMSPDECSNRGFPILFFCSWARRYNVPFLGQSRKE